MEPDPAQSWLQHRDGARTLAELLLASVRRKRTSGFKVMPPHTPANVDVDVDYEPDDFHSEPEEDATDANFQDFNEQEKPTAMLNSTPPSVRRKGDTISFVRFRNMDDDRGDEEEVPDNAATEDEDDKQTKRTSKTCSANVDGVADDDRHDPDTAPEQDAKETNVQDPDQQEESRQRTARRP